jgi:hypothetical protein
MHAYPQFQPTWVELFSVVASWISDSKSSDSPSERDAEPEAPE